jgi:hypothetical protein
MSAHFRDFREITARKAGDACLRAKDGPHKVAAGERIGWAPRTREVCCAACWAQWCAENAEADRCEASGAW